MVMDEVRVSPYGRTDGLEEWNRLSRVGWHGD